MANQKNEDLKKLVPDSSKRNIKAAANILLQKPDLMEPMVELSFTNDGSWSTRAARALELCDELDPSKTVHLYPLIIEKLPSGISGVRRSYLKLLSRHINLLVDETLSQTIDLCMKYAQDLEEEPAIRYYSIEILHLIATTNHWFINELRALINILQIKEHTHSFKAKCRYVIDALNKIETKA